MARIRHIEIKNFRGIMCLDWHPSAGVNCLIGPGDSGKSTILDAIDLCLGARRNVQFSDADFYNLEVEDPLLISITLGELHDNLKNLDAYGNFLRGYDKLSNEIVDEPTSDTETVLTLQLSVGSELDPNWSLYSERAKELGYTKLLSWADRVRLAPTRIGVYSDHNFTWRNGSILNRLTGESAETSAAFVTAAREARKAFGNQANEQVRETLEIVKGAAAALGISAGKDAQALLDAHSASFGSGTISLHDIKGVPLRGLGTGSSRLLVAGLQKQAAEASSILLLDELEYGLEPHRIIRLIGSLGAKQSPAPTQVFVTTHSPIALRELNGSQLFIVRQHERGHSIEQVGTDDSIQGAIRRFPEAFLASRVLVCEGASEVGFIKGIDEYLTNIGLESIYASGASLVDACGGGNHGIVTRARTFLDLGYEVAILRDADEATPESEADFIADGGKVFVWDDGNCLEQELFECLPDSAVGELIDKAIKFHTEKLINEHIVSHSAGKVDLNEIQIAGLVDGYEAHVKLLGRVAKSKGCRWFKSVTFMLEVARDVVAPNFQNGNTAFAEKIDTVMACCHGQQ